MANIGYGQNYTGTPAPMVQRPPKVIDLDADTNIHYPKKYTGVKSPFVVKIDKSLSKEGFAADAKSTGEAIQEALDNYQEFEQRVVSLEESREEDEQAIQQLQEEKEDAMLISTSTSFPLIANTSYFLGEIHNSLVLQFPDSGELGDMISVMFSQGSLVYEVEVVGNFIGLQDKEFDDQNVNYEIIAMWNGIYWVCVLGEVIISE